MLNLVTLDFKFHNDILASSSISFRKFVSATLHRNLFEFSHINVRNMVRTKADRVPSKGGLNRTRIFLTNLINELHTRMLLFVECRLFTAVASKAPRKASTGIPVRKNNGRKSMACSTHSLHIFF